MWEKLANFDLKGLKGYSHMLDGNRASSSTTSYGFHHDFNQNQI